MIRLAVFASHTGTNFQTICDACNAGRLSARVALLICNNSTAPVMERARLADIPALHLSSKTQPDSEMLDLSMQTALNNAGAELIVLAGYMKKLLPGVLRQFENRIINVHPSLLPKHGGPGFYGHYVHEQVLSSGDTVTGATVHLVNEAYDEGRILMQRELAVKTDDTPESLADRLRPVEHELLINAIQKFADGELP